MDYNEYYSAREQVVRILKEDLEGPLEEDEVIENEPPVAYYLIGKLYPKNILEIDDNGDFVDVEDILEDEEEIAFGNSRYPSARGFTFSITKNTKRFNVECTAGRYVSLEDETKGWKREQIKSVNTILVSELIEKRKLQFEIYQKLKLQVHVHRITNYNCIFITVTMINHETVDDFSYKTLSKLTYFQTKLLVNSIENGAFCELGNNQITSLDEELLEWDMLYHESNNFASGHGCAVEWNLDANGKVREIISCNMPEYELFQMKPSGENNINICSMYFLANATYDQIKPEILLFTEHYDEWIKKQELLSKNLSKSYSKEARKNIEKCRMVYHRIKDSINVLSNPLALKAFQLANETMLRQRMGHKYDEKKRFDYRWYPFQIAFLLQELSNIIDPKTKERAQVDLLWFPTGGGKTEAYLGIAAFTIFYRRLRELSNHEDDIGVAVIMRYTLRLLSLQQFERATSMICAAELIRKREKLGKRLFGIGLWAGAALTPNLLSEADKYLMKRATTNISNPAQLKKCPWCGETINEKDYFIDKVSIRMTIKCPNEKCEFHHGLPVFLIDDEIYHHKPSFIMGTIDKFAQIAHKSQAGELLGVDLPHPPELIIQDELHLISGPLGTISSIYEAAIDKLCERNGIQPKIIASTATIRNAKNQILSLYGKEHLQFPPQGISINDSYFAKLSTREERPARLYLGILPSGSSKTTAFTRIMGSLLFATRYLTECGYSEEVIDSFWTETGYFNNLKELGSALTRVIDSVQDRFLYLKNTKFVDKYVIKNEKNRYDRVCELTSRNSSAELGEIIQKDLLVPYKKDGTTKPYDFLLASNMISVGVDVARLGSMVVVGQPLKTAEYIQATSRVGRTTPGLVITLYQPMKSRDRSHFEQFVQYHSTFYKFVEATSVTPFSDRARDRALQALYIILARYTIPQLRNNEDAKEFNRDLEGLNDIKRYILEYVKKIDPDEVENVCCELEEIEKEWEDIAAHSSDLVYSDYKRSKKSLYKEDYLEGDRFRMMNSMRDVEPGIGVSTEE